MAYSPGVVLWLAVFGRVLGSDRLLAVTGRAAPRFSLLFSMTLGCIARFRENARQIRLARAGAGLAKEKPLHEALDQFSTLVTLSLEGSMTTADAMRARGYGKGRRRVYDPFTFGVADGVELAVVLLLSITVLAVALTGGLTFYFDPQLEWVTLSPLGAAAAGLLCFCPTISNVGGGTAMAAIEAEKLNFTYPDADRAALSDVTFSIPSGGFYLLMGPSGSGKSTLLRLLQGEIAPHGALRGQLHCDSPAGFVFQNPQDSLVTDSVQRELAFSPEHVGLDGAAVARRVGECAAFFHLEPLMERTTASLSGGGTATAVPGGSYDRLASGAFAGRALCGTGSGSGRKIFAGAAAAEPRVGRNGADEYPYPRRCFGTGGRRAVAPCRALHLL